MSITTPGYEAEPADVAADVANWIDGISDPSELYARSTAGQAHHEAVAAALQRARDRALAELNAGGLSYEKLTELTRLSRAGVQKAVERGRRS